MKIGAACGYHHSVLTILGLALFESITSVDNAIINAEALVTMKAIHDSAPVLLIGGGVFFIFLFCHWIFLEPKKFGLPGEDFFARQGAWFYALVSVALMVIVWFAINKDPMLGFGAVVGSTALFITHGFKRYAEAQEERLLHNDTHLSDIAKIIYLEVQFCPERAILPLRKEVPA